MIKPQSGAIKIRSRNYIDLSPQFHALYSSQEATMLKKGSKHK